MPVPILSATLHDARAPIFSATFHDVLVPIFSAISHDVLEQVSSAISPDVLVSISCTHPSPLHGQSDHNLACCWHCSFFHGSWGLIHGCFLHGYLGPVPGCFLSSRAFGMCSSNLLLSPWLGASTCCADSLRGVSLCSCANFLGNPSRCPCANFLGSLSQCSCATCLSDLSCLTFPLLVTAVWAIIGVLRFCPV